MGARARQGPHQAAQKSTNTGCSDFRTSWSKFASVTSKIPLLAISPPGVPLAANRRLERSISQRWLHVSYHLVGCITASEIAKVEFRGFQLPVSGKSEAKQQAP